ncbi:VWA domain-containing protein, partial [Pseudomonas sp. MWU13-2625]
GGGASGRAGAGELTGRREGAAGGTIAAAAAAVSGA